MPATRREFLALAGSAAAAANKTTRTEGPRFFVATLTPMDASGRFDEALNRDLLAFLRERGVDGALVLGTTGEFSSFSVQERRKILEASMRARGSMEAMVQVGAPNLPDTLELLEHATSAGAGYALVLPLLQESRGRWADAVFQPRSRGRSHSGAALSHPAGERGRDQP